MHDRSVLFQELSGDSLKACAAHYLGEELLDWELLTGGLFNTTYYLETEKGKYVLRLGPVNRERLLPYEVALMQTEPQIQALLHSKGIPTSKTLVLDTGRTFLDRDVAIVEYIPGHNMAEYSMLQRQRREVERQLGAMTRQIHTISAKDLENVPKKPFGRTSQVLTGNGSATWKEAIVKEVCQWRASAEKIALFEESFFDRVEKLFFRMAWLFESVQEPVLVHGDLWYGNILLDDSKRVTAILDCDRSLFGDPEFEFAVLLMDQNAFQEGYEGRRYRGQDALLRGRLYKFLAELEDCYILRHEYCRERDCRELQELLRGKLSELEKVK